MGGPNLVANTNPDMETMFAQGLSALELVCIYIYIWNPVFGTDRHYLDLAFRLLVMVFF